MKAILAAMLMPILATGCATTARLPSPAGTDLAVAAAVQQKMRAIIFPEFICEDATIPQAMAFLKRRMQEVDPDGEGISICLTLEQGPEPGVVPQPWGAAQEEPRVLESPRESHPVPHFPPSPGVAPEEPRLTLHLRNVTLEEVVERLCLATGLRWTLAPKLTIGPARLLREQK